MSLELRTFRAPAQRTLQRESTVKFHQEVDKSNQRVQHGFQSTRGERSVPYRRGSIRLHASILTFVTTVAAYLLVSTTVAPAEASCVTTPDGSQEHLFAYWFDYPGDQNAGGVRAGVQARKDSSLCATDYGYGPGLWIGLEEDTQYGKGLVQGGLFYTRDTNGVPHFCRFYEQYPADYAQLYDCGSFDSGAYYYFEVFKYSTASGNMVAVEDCGESDPNYSACSVVLSGIPASYVKSAHATAAAEELHEYCEDTMFGNSSNPANIGNGGGGDPIEVEHDAGDPWIGNEPFEGQADNGGYQCSHFHKSLPNPQTLVVWDDRNSN